MNMNNVWGLIMGIGVKLGQGAKGENWGSCNSINNKKVKNNIIYNNITKYNRIK